MVEVSLLATESLLDTIKFVCSSSGVVVEVNCIEEELTGNEELITGDTIDDLAIVVSWGVRGLLSCSPLFNVFSVLLLA